MPAVRTSDPDISTTTRMAPFTQIRDKAMYCCKCYRVCLRTTAVFQLLHTPLVPELNVISWNCKTTSNTYTVEEDTDSSMLAHQTALEHTWRMKRGTNDTCSCPNNSSQCYRGPSRNNYLRYLVECRMPCTVRTLLRQLLSVRTTHPTAKEIQKSKVLPRGVKSCQKSSKFVRRQHSWISVRTKYLFRSTRFMQNLDKPASFRFTT